MPPTLDISPLKEVENAFYSFQQSSVHSEYRSESARKYKAIVIDDEEQVRSLFVDCLGPAGFNVAAYSEADAEPVLREIVQDNSQLTMPDVFVIDLELAAGNNRGMDLIERLTTHGIPSKIVGMSASPSSSKLNEAITKGASDVIPKPFDPDPTVKRIKIFASIGMKQRLYRLNSHRRGTTDPLRQNRPVLLSYSREDRKTASILRSQIEASGIDVWYASDDLGREDLLRERILKAVDEVCVFVPIITDYYPSSPFCLGKMIRFYRRLRMDKSPTLLPVLDGSVEKFAHFDLIRPILEEHPCADITSYRFADGLTAMLGRIQQIVAQHRRSCGDCLLPARPLLDSATLMTR